MSGVFRLGSEAVDKTWVVTSLRHAQSLFALPGGATTIELKVGDVFAANEVADEIHARTGLTADSWMTLNAELLSGLSAQSSSKTMIQFFVVVTVALGIASVLIVSVVQKSREIGILRAVGTPARRVLAVFLIQGGVLGICWRILRGGSGNFLRPGVRDDDQQRRWTSQIPGSGHDRSRGGFNHPCHGRRRDCRGHPGATSCAARSRHCRSPWRSRVRACRRWSWCRWWKTDSSLSCASPISPPSSSSKTRYLVRRLRSGTARFANRCGTMGTAGAGGREDADASGRGRQSRCLAVDREPELPWRPPGEAARSSSRHRGRDGPYGTTS